MSTNVHRFVRWEPVNPGRTLSCNFGVDGVHADGLAFSLASVVNHGEFTQLYDQYKILGVKIYFDYSPDIAFSVGSSNAFPKLWIKRDYDDNTPPTLTEMAESNQARCMRFEIGRLTRSIYIKPAMLIRGYEGVTTDSFLPSWRRWIDCGDPSTPHYGLKLLAQGLPSTNMGGITIRVRYDLMFKNVR